MTRARGSIVVAGLLAALLVSSPASAAEPDVVIFRVEGVVNLVERVDGVQVGQAYELEYTFDGATAASYSTAIFATYPAVTAMSLKIDGVLVASSSGGTISIANDVSNYDLYRADFSPLVEEVANLGPAPLGEVFLEMQAVALGGPTDAITSLALPLSPPDPAEYTRYAPYVAFGYFDRDCDEDEDDCPDGLVQGSVDTITLVPPGPPDPDLDDDGVADAIGTGIAGGFTDGTTFGRITTGTGVLVEDAGTPAGVRITTTADATSPVQLQVCGFFSLSLSPGSDVTITCGSVTAVVTSGTTRIDIGAGGFVTVAAGGDATVDQLPGGDYVVVNNATVAVDVTRGGVTTSLPAGGATYSAPQVKADCKKGGWRVFGVFNNQGQCIASLGPTS